MHSLANLGPADGNPIPTPAIRKIGFAEDPAQVTVAHLLIHGWSIQRPSECNNPPCGDVSAWGKEINSLTREEREQLPQNPDLKTCHIPWRDQIYYTWNHVFYDVGKWLSGAYGTRAFKPPNTEVFALEFPSPENGDSCKVPIATKIWDAETLLVAGYLAPGISLRLETLRVDRDQSEPFHSADIEHGDRFSVLYVQKGVHVQFYLEGERQQGVDGLAAVIVYGPLPGESRPVVDGDDKDEKSL